MGSERNLDMAVTFYYKGWSTYFGSSSSRIGQDSGIGKRGIGLDRGCCGIAESLDERES